MVSRYSPSRVLPFSVFTDPYCLSQRSLILYVGRTDVIKDVADLLNKNIKLSLYADDVKLYSAHKTIALFLQSAIDELVTWSVK